MENAHSTVRDATYWVQILATCWNILHLLEGITQQLYPLKFNPGKTLEET
jgi:hypothetical protein